MVISLKFFSNLWGILYITFLLLITSSISLAMNKRLVKYQKVPNYFYHICRFQIWYSCTRLLSCSKVSIIGSKKWLWFQTWVIMTLYYKIWITKCYGMWQLFSYKMQQKFVTKCVSFFGSKFDSFITECESYYKIRQF